MWAFLRTDPASQGTSLMRLCWQAHGRQKEQPCKGLGESVQASKAEQGRQAAGVMGSMEGRVARDATGATWRKGLTVNVNMVNS